jgi:hypothetical protein
MQQLLCHPVDCEIIQGVGDALASSGASCCPQGGKLPDARAKTGDAESFPHAQQ